MSCSEIRIQVKESAEARGNAQAQKVLTELRGEDRSASVECEHDGGRQSQGGCLWFSKL